MAVFIEMKIQASRPEMSFRFPRYAVVDGLMVRVFISVSHLWVSLDYVGDFVRLGCFSFHRLLAPF